MKNKLLLSLAALCALVMSSCGSDVDYAKFIPKEAAVVGRIDVAQIADKGDFADNEKLTEILKKSIKESQLSAKGKIVAEKIVSDPKMTGIDLRKPIFFYSSTDAKGDHSGIVATVLNRSDLTNFVNYLSKEEGGEQAQEYRGVTYMGDDDFLLAFNDEWLVFKDTHATHAHEAIDLLLSREALTPEQTVASVAGYKRMIEGDGIASLVVRGEILAKVMSETNNRYNISQAYQDMANYDYIFDLDAEDGRLGLDMETFASTEEGGRKLRETKKMFSEIQGEYADYVDKDALLSVVSNLNGKEIIKFVEQNGLPEEQIRSFRPYIEALNGDAVFTLNALKANLNGLDYRMFAHLSNPQPYLALKSQIADAMGVNEYATNEFSLSLGSLVSTADVVSEMGLADENAAPNNGNIMLYFGVHNSSSLFGSFSISSNAFDKVANPLPKDNYHGRIAYVRLNSTNALDVIKLVSKNTGTDNDYESKIGLHILGLIDYIDLYATTDSKGRINVVMRDKDQNALATLVGELSTIVSIFN